jgi:hypothetical protein
MVETIGRGQETVAVMTLVALDERILERGAQSLATPLGR